MPLTHLHDTKPVNLKTKSQAFDLASQMPRLILEGRRVASSLLHGLHGLRRSGSGEDFWQYRPFTSGEAASRIDWRRSARDNHLYVREQEWESAHGIRFWVDTSKSMGFASHLASQAKIEHALVLGLALSYHLVDQGERVGWLGGKPPRAARNTIETMAHEQLTFNQEHIPQSLLHGRDEVVLISDWLAPFSELQQNLDRLLMQGVRGHAVMVLDPAEESFPFTGEMLLHEPEQDEKRQIGDAKAWGETYRQTLYNHKEQLKALLSQHGWTYTLHHTHRPLSETALRLAHLVASKGRFLS